MVHTGCILFCGEYSSTWPARDRVYCTKMNTKSTWHYHWITVIVFCTTLFNFGVASDLLVWLHGNPGSPTVASETLGMYEVCAEIGMLSSMSTSKEYNVLVYTESSSATDGSDYALPVSPYITFPIGSVPGTVECLSITIIDDGVTEGDESFTVGISSDSEEISVYPYSNQVIQIEGQSRVEIKAYSGGHANTDYFDVIVNGVRLFEGTVEDLRGLNVAVIDPLSGAVLHTQRFDTDWSVNQDASNNFAALILSLPDSRLVAIAVYDDARANLNGAAIAACKSIGSGLIDNLVFRGSWAIIGRKGAFEGTVPEILSNTNEAGVSLFYSLVPKNRCKLYARSTGYLKADELSTIVIADNTVMADYTRGITISVLAENACEVESTFTFDTHTSNPDAEDLANFIWCIPYGRIVVAVVEDTASNSLSENAKRAMESIGSSLVRNISYRTAWVIFGKKGLAPGSAIENLNDGTVHIAANVNPVDSCSETNDPLNCDYTLELAHL